jgi:uncharacterized protein YyaL (SSP411 family)
MIKAYPLNLILLFCSALPAGKAWSQDYSARIQILYAGINSHLRDSAAGLYFETTDSAHKENPHSWLWPLCALAQATNEMEKLNPESQYMPSVVKAIDQYYSDSPPVPAFQDYVRKERASSRFYDDNEWVAIAYLDAYQRTHRKTYLQTAKLIYRFIQSGIDTAAGGGAYWKEGDRKNKNTCSNGPAILVALQLFQITRQKQFLETALTLYHWTASHLQAPEGTYYDNIAIPSLKVAKAIYTYNTGTMLQATVLLFEITRDSAYLLEAERIARAGKDRFFKNGHLPGEYWFNAVMLRAYVELYKVDKNKDWINFFVDDAEYTWSTARDAENMLGEKPAKRLIDQAAMIEIYARLQQIR